MGREEEAVDRVMEAPAPGVALPLRSALGQDEELSGAELCEEAARGAGRRRRKPARKERRRAGRKRGVAGRQAEKPQTLCF